jgi:uncharacterized protein YggE
VYKKLLIAVLATSIILCIGAGFLIFSSKDPGTSFARTDTPALDMPVVPNTISVDGEGIVYAKPDIAYISVGVVTENKDAKAAQEENTKVMDNVVQKLKGLGIKDQDIKTVNYSIYPQQDWSDERQPTIFSYRVENMVEVTIRNLDKTGEILDALAGQGINQAYNIRFDIQDTDRQYQEALDKAIKQAEKKAEAIAKASGKKLKGILSIGEGSKGAVIYQGIGRSMDIDVAEAERMAVPISSGQLEIKATVNVIFQY